VLFLQQNKIIAQCDNIQAVFGAKEKLTYGIYYNWGFIKIKLAKVVFWTKNIKYQNKNLLLLQNISKTYDKYSWIIDAEDYYASYIEPKTLKVYKHIQKTVVDDYFTDNEYKFDYKNNRVSATVENSNTPEFTDTLNLQNCLMDLLTAVYYLRSIDYQNLKINEKVYIPVILDTAIHNIYFKYLGYDVLKYKDKEEKSFLIIPSIVETSTFKSGETMKVWISSKKNRLPLKMESELWIGKILAQLEKTEGLQLPDCQ
jgi:hypothetical protein